jgi:radical SAM superfamily enzyme
MAEEIQMSDYADKYDNMIIIVMSIVIVLSLAGVIALNVAYRPDCVPSYETYCEPQAADPHH